MDLPKLDMYVSAMRQLGVKRLRTEAFEIELDQAPVAEPEPESTEAPLTEPGNIYDLAFPGGRPTFRKGRV